MTPPSPLVLAFGDSLIAGYGLAAADAFPHQLERALRGRHPGASVIGAGVSGDTTGSALARLPRVLSGLAARPDLAIVQIGSNDVLRGIDPATMRRNLDEIVTEIARCGMRVLIATVTPPAFLASQVGDYLAIHSDAARRHGAALCDFFPAGVLGRADMVLADRLHPNAKAIRAVVDHLLPVVERELTD